MEEDMEEDMADLEENSPIYNKSQYTKNSNTTVEEYLIDLNDCDLVDQNNNRLNNFSLFQKPSIYHAVILTSYLCLIELLTGPSFIELNMRKICQGISSNSPEDQTVCDQKEVQRILAEITSIATVINGCISTYMIGKWGSIADREGRVKVLLYIASIKAIGTILHLYVVAENTPYNKIALTLVGSVTSLNGGIYTIIAIGNSYISDVTSLENRSICLSYITSGFYGAMCIGPILSSTLIKYTSMKEISPILLSIVMSIIYVVLCYFFAIEPRHPLSLKKSKEINDELINVNNILVSDEGTDPSNGFVTNITNTLKYYVKIQIAHIVNIMRPIKKLLYPTRTTSSNNSRRTVLLLLIIDILFTCAIVGPMQAIILYSMYKYNWKAYELNIYMFSSGLLRVLVLMFLFPKIIGILRSREIQLTASIDNIDIKCIRYALVCLAIGPIPLLVKPQYLISLILLTIFDSVGRISMPVLQSTITKYCHDNNIGEIYGCLALVRSISTVVSMALILKFYSRTINTDSKELFLTIQIILSILAIIVTFFVI